MGLLPVMRFKISGHSMEPTFKENDKVFVFRFGKLKKGDIVVFKHSSKYLVKRIDKIKENAIYISGDNKKDSLKIDSIKKEDILGKVIFKL